MFTYLDASLERPSLTALMELYWQTMPAYQVSGKPSTHLTYPQATLTGRLRLVPDTVIRTERQSIFRCGPRPVFEPGFESR